MSSSSSKKRKTSRSSSSKSSTRSRSSSSRDSKSNKKGKPPSIWAVLAVLLLLFAGYLHNEGIVDLGPLADIIGISDDEQSAPVTQKHSTGAFQAYFTTPYLVYPDDRDNRTPPPFEKALLADIAAAQRSVDVVAFEYNLESLADALVNAHERGVNVRLALDEENLEDPEDAEWAGKVEEAGIPISWQESTAFLHSKFAIIDDAIVWMGSLNFTNNGTYRNNNNLLRFTVPALVENYTAEFEQMMGGTFGNSKESLAPNPVIMVDDIKIENYFSPQDRPLETIVNYVMGAQKSIRFLTFSYTSDEIGEAMIARKQAGVEVQGVFESRSSRGIGAEFERLEAAGVDVLEDGNCYTMHHKVIIIDDAIVITGSYNFTKRAEETNDENFVIIQDAELASTYVEEFNRVYDQAMNPTRCGR